MTGNGFQLFPPPPRARQTSPARRPSPAAKPSVPAPVVERKDSANHMEDPMDFHELVIQVNSVPVSPSNNNNMTPTITAPPRAHVAPASSFVVGPTAPSPIVTAQEDFYTGSPPSFSTPRVYTPEPNRAVSPAFSTCETLVRSNTTTTRPPRSPQEEIQMRSMFPTYNPNLPLSQQAYKPTQISPTYLQTSRSPYSAQSYVPHSNTSSRSTMAAKPPPKTFFTPSNLLDNLWLAANGQEEPAIQIYTLKMHRATLANPTITFGTTPSLPFYSLATTNLAGEDAPVQSIINELLIQRHHPTQPRVLPIAQLDLIAPPSMDTVAFDPQQQETTLLTSIYPKLAALQALDAAATSPTASRIALVDPGAQSPAAQRFAEDVLAGAAQRECCTLLWTRDDPTQAANPWAQHIPSEGSYTLHHPTLGNFPIQIEGDCSLINAPSTRPITTMYGHNLPSTPATPAQKPASITLLNPYILSTSTPRTNAFSPLPIPPRFDAQNRPISATPSTMSVTQLPTTTDATADDATLARLDFSADALILNLGALTRFGNPFLVDVAASTLCAVAIAEATRGRSSRKTSLRSFDAPPVNDYVAITPETKAKGLKDEVGQDWEGVDARSKEGRAQARRAATSTLRKLFLSLKSTTGDEGASSRATSRARDRNADFDKDIELGTWPGHAPSPSTTTRTKETRAKKKARREAEKSDRLPFVARAVIGVLAFAFKAVVWMFMLLFKIVAGVGKTVLKSASKH